MAKWPFEPWSPCSYGKAFTMMPRELRCVLVQEQRGIPELKQALPFSFSSGASSSYLEDSNSLTTTFKVAAPLHSFSLSISFSFVGFIPRPLPIQHRPLNHSSPTLASADAIDVQGEERVFSFPNANSLAQETTTTTCSLPDSKMEGGEGSRRVGALFTFSDACWGVLKFSQGRLSPPTPALWPC